jgi:hypothetical protein
VQDREAEYGDGNEQRDRMEQASADKDEVRHEYSGSSRALNAEPPVANSPSFMSEACARTVKIVVSVLAFNSGLNNGDAGGKVWSRAAVMCDGRAAALRSRASLRDSRAGHALALRDLTTAWSGGRS